MQNKILKDTYDLNRWCIVTTLENNGENVTLKYIDLTSGNSILKTLPIEKYNKKFLIDSVNAFSIGAINNYF